MTPSSHSSPLQRLVVSNTPMHVFAWDARLWSSGAQAAR